MTSTVTNTMILPFWHYRTVFTKWVISSHAFTFEKTRGQEMENGGVILLYELSNSSKFEATPHTLSMQCFRWCIKAARSEARKNGASGVKYLS